MTSNNSSIIDGISADLAGLGLRRGDLVILHSSFKHMGPPELTPADVVRTLIDYLGPEGTLMTPTFTYSYSGIWNVKPFHKEKTPGCLNGVLTETLRTWPGALRSQHPTYSVAAFGRYAHAITHDKANASALGKGSSYETALKLEAKILLLGVGNDRNSMLHYAEIAAGLPYNDIPFRTFWGRTALVEEEGRIVEKTLPVEYPACSLNFGVADSYLLEKGIMTQGNICKATAIFMSASKMVDAVVERLKTEPDWLLCNGFTCEPCSLRKRRLKEMRLI